MSDKEETEIEKEELPDDNSSAKNSTDDILPNPQSKSAVLGDVCQVFGVFFAIGIRLLLLAFCIFTVWLVVYQLEEQLYWILLINSASIVLEGIYIVLTRAGQERKWVCVCFLCYLFSCVPSIWILELDRLDTYQSKTENTSDVQVGVSGLKTEVRLDPSIALSITEQVLIFLLILCRWLLPRGEITRNQLSQLLFVFIGMASDVMELFQLFDESEIREDRTLTLVILFVWTLSLFQFTLVLTMSLNAKKKRVAFTEDTSSKESNEEDTGCLVSVFKTELWSLMLSIMVQDGPFLAVRLYALIKYNLINYTIIFFTCKNVLVILLLFYRLLILLLEKVEEMEATDDDNVKEPEKTEETGTNKPKPGSPSSRTTSARRRNQVHPEEEKVEHVEEE